MCASHLGHTCFTHTCHHTRAGGVLVRDQRAAEPGVPDAQSKRRDAPRLVEQVSRVGCARVGTTGRRLTQPSWHDLCPSVCMHAHPMQPCTTVCNLWGVSTSSPAGRQGRRARPSHTQLQAMARVLAQLSMCAPCPCCGAHQPQAVPRASE